MGGIMETFSNSRNTLGQIPWCDCVGQSSFPVPLPGKKKPLITCIYVFITHGSIMYIYKHFHACVPAQKTLLTAWWFTLALCSSSVTAPLTVVFQLRTFLHFPLPPYGSKGQAVLPPVAFVPMTLSQTFAFAISILLPLIAPWTWSWVNGLVLSWLE